MDNARKEGQKKGREEGREEERIDIIQKCLQKNIAVEDIAFFTGYSQEQISYYEKNGTLTL